MSNERRGGSDLRDHVMQSSLQSGDVLRVLRLPQPHQPQKEPRLHHATGIGP